MEATYQVEFGSLLRLLIEPSLQQLKLQIRTLMMARMAHGSPVLPPELRIPSAMLELLLMLTTLLELLLLQLLLALWQLISLVLLGLLLLLMWLLSLAPWSLPICNLPGKCA